MNSPFAISFLFFALSFLLPWQDAYSEKTAEVVPITPVDEVYPLIPSWSGARVLHLGDSHVYAGLTAGLSRYFKKAGARYETRCWVGSRSKSWVISGKLKKAMAKNRPDVVIITLGTNAMKIQSPQKYSMWIKQIIRKINPRFCYWLGPPPLIDDRNNFNEMLKSKTAGCRYFDSFSMDIKKHSDGKFHLTRAQGEKWATLVWRWMNDLD